MKFSTTNFRNFFCLIIPEKYRYFSGKIPQEISKLSTLIVNMLYDRANWNYCLERMWKSRSSDLH